MAAAAVARAPWQEARAACLKTVLSGRDGAGDSSLAAVVDGEAMPVFGPEASAFLHTYKDGRTQAFSNLCEQGPPSLGFSEQEVGRGSFIQKPGRKHQSWAQQKQVGCGWVWQFSHLPQAHTSHFTTCRVSGAGP